ncbi:RNA-binding S4 domain-containing protein [Maricaulis sp.]|uniref:RNA-binding S4 domain-containing protein n=1 Tax=unclassified Maricaulis TaxID=2632371 RepID=UPI001B1BBDED|nr:RNA-binding S4 domain-containing protein [Maricaulis sp.]MBO6796436.1 RNA-binding S4 domain-containing protein [Maricaulis sp.]
MSEPEAHAQRIDLWLWHARFYKTRTLATREVGNGRIRLARTGQIRRISKASATLTVEDELTFPRNGKIVRIRVLALSTRRGPASEAQTLYELLDED